jgi:hypothetical protein
MDDRTIAFPRKGESPKQFGMLLFKNRLARLNRLVQLNAPNYILSNEIRMLEDAGWMAFPDEMSMVVKDRRYLKLKEGYGYCNSTVECDDRVDVFAGDTMCKKHKAEQEKFEKEHKELELTDSDEP